MSRFRRSPFVGIVEFAGTRVWTEKVSRVPSFQAQQSYRWSNKLKSLCCKLARGFGGPKKCRAVTGRWHIDRP